MHEHAVLAKQREHAVGVRPEAAQVAEAVHGLHAAPARVGERGLEGEVVAVDAAEDGDAAIFGYRVLARHPRLHARHAGWMVERRRPEGLLSAPVRQPRSRQPGEDGAGIDAAVSDHARLGALEEAAVEAGEIRLGQPRPPSRPSRPSAKTGMIFTRGFSMPWP